MAQHPMHAFASFIMRGRLPAVLVTSGFAVLSLLMPPLTQVSGAVIALVTLRHGAQQGFLVLAGAAAVVGVLILFTASRTPAVLILAVWAATWLPVWILAIVLRGTRSTTAMLNAAAALGIAYVVGMHMGLGDTAAWWRSVLSETIMPAMEGSGAAVGAADMATVIDTMAGVMTGLIGAAMVIGAVASLFIGRWWQAALYNPGGFRTEFHQLRIGRQLSVFALVVGAIAMFGPPAAATMAGDVLMVLIGVYLFGGVALMHAAVAARNGHVGWLIAMYLLMAFILPQMAVVLAAAGFTDSWMDLRRHFRQGEE